MNRVILYGHFADVQAHTNGSVDVKADFTWKLSDESYSATFVTVDDAWIEVRVKSSSFEEFEKQIKHRPFCKIEGRLRTEVGLGSGVVKNYIWVE